MKKKFKIFLSGFVGLVLILAVLPFLLPQKTYKNWFVAQVESAFPVHLQVAEFRLRFLPLPSLKLGGVVIYAKNFPQLIAKADEISASVHLRELFFKQVVADLKFKTPIFYLQNFSSGWAAPAKTSNGASGWRFKIASFYLLGGVLQMQKGSITDVDLSLLNLALSGKSKIPFSISLVPLGDGRRFVLKGDFKLDADRSLLLSKNLKIRFDNFEGTGQMECNLKTFSTTGKIESPSLSYGDTTAKNARLDFAFLPPKLEIKNLVGDILDAKVKGNGSVLFAKPVVYQFDWDLENVDLTKLAFLKKQVVGKGMLHASLSGKMVEGHDAAKDLNAIGFIRVSEGAIPNLKLGQEIFGHAVWDILRPLAGFNKEALNSLKGLDAKVEKLNIPFEIKNGVAKILDGKWEHPRYQIGLNGDISLNQKLSGQGAFVLPEKELNALVTEPAPRKALANAKGELVLPFFVSGTFSNPKVEPDKKTLVPRFTKAVAARGFESIKKGILDILNPSPDP